MATYRQVHISFWQDPFVIGLTPEEKYFYLYLMTNSKTTQCGIYELPKRVVEFETGYNRETVDKLLDRFSSYRKIDYYEQTQEIIILNWIKHNSINSPKVKACITKELKAIKYAEYRQLFYHLCKRYGYGIDRLSIDLGEEEEQEEEQKEEKEQEQEVVVPQFDSPHKTNIQKWLKKYDVEYGIKQYEDICSFIGVVEIEVIEYSIGLSESKTAAYTNSILKRLTKEGKTTIEMVNPRPKVGDNVVHLTENVRQGTSAGADKSYEGAIGWLPSKYNRGTEVPEVSGQ